ncbi:hypothetical protein ACXYTP_25145 [Tsukamurella ocularis]
MRYYRIDLLDFYRGTLSGRRLAILLRNLPSDASLVRALNDGRPGWTQTDHLLADLWQLTVQVNSKDPASAPDHPMRAAMEEKARTAAKAARLAELKGRFQHLKDRYRKP